MVQQPSDQSGDESRRILAAVLDSSDDAIVSQDLSGIILAWNRGAERIYGYAADEVVGRSVSIIIPPDRPGELAHILRRVSAGERVGPEDSVRVSKHGTRIQISLTISPIRDEGERVIGALAVSRDITAQRRTDMAVLRGEARWRAIVESAVDAIVVIDRRGRIESFNPAAEKLFGYPFAEVCGKNVSMLMPLPYAREHDHYLHRYLDTGDARIIGIGREVTGLRKDGTTFPMHLSVGEASIAGETKFTGIIRDLTSQVTLESKLREESGLARLGELAAVLAHEIKNPLAAVSGAIQMIGAQFPLDSEEHGVVQEILHRLDALNDLMGDLLLYARPPQPNFSRVDVVPLLESLIAFLQTDPSWARLEVALEGRVRAVTADESLLRIAVENLLLNAAQAMRGEGTLRVRLHESDGMAWLDIVDSGPGMPAEVRDRVFTPFFTTKARGTGLGLATVRRIAESHRGKISIFESSSTGTTMRLGLPLNS
jgi:two-component system sensor kinase FixL